MNRQFAHLKMLKRAGRGAFLDGVAGTAAGELAVVCPACPHPNVNLPENWESMPSTEQYVNSLLLTSLQQLTICRYRFRLILALDANFRLKNLRRPSAVDPGLHTGNAYFVANRDYFEHLARDPKQKDVS